MRYAVIFLLMLLAPLNGWLQPSYNSCDQAMELCPGTTSGLNNISANKTFCPECEDDFTFCFSANNTIWFKFTTNSTGGDVSLAFSGLLFQTNAGQDNALQATILSASVPCNSASYTAVGNCISNGTGPFVLTATALPANTTYYVVVSGDLSGAGISLAAECTFDVTLSGTGVDRPVPGISISGPTAMVCKNSIVTATASLTDCPDNSVYMWYINGVFTAQTTDPVFQTSDLNDGDVITVRTSCYLLCSDTVEASTTPVSVYSFPLDAGPDQYILPGETVQLTGSTTAPDFSWTPSFNISASDILSPFVYPDQTTTYTLTATENGCTLSDNAIVFVEEQLIFPTTFSPNDDGINDVWMISGIDLYPDCFVRIYDRWGQEIFQSVGYTKTKAWDGTKGSSKLSEGVYFYIVELRDDDKQEFKGSITLIR